MKKSTIWLLVGGLGTAGLLASGLAVAEGMARHSQMKSFGLAEQGHDHEEMEPLMAGFAKGELKLEMVEQKMMERFKAMDSDGNGALSPDEFAALTLDRLRKLDTNQDGVLSRDEMPHRKGWKGKRGKHHGGDEAHGKGHSS